MANAPPKHRNAVTPTLVRQLRQLARENTPTRVPAYHCRDCQLPVSKQAAVCPTEGKAACCVAGLALGAGTKDPWVAVGLAVLGTVVGHWIDSEVTPRCPTCGAVLQAILPHHLAT